MKSITKAGILLSILMLPVLVFLFLKLFAKNHYDIPTYFATDSVLVNGRYKITAAHKIPPFSFVDQNGDTFISELLTDRIVVTGFLLPGEMAMSSKITTELKRIQEAFADFPEVRILSFSIDSQNHDVSDTLKVYAETFRIDTSSWTLLAGSRDSVYYLAQKGLLISSEQASNTSEAPGETLVLIDKAGHIRGYYAGTDRAEIDRLIREIQVLLYNYGN